MMSLTKNPKLIFFSKVQDLPHPWGFEQLSNSICWSSNGRPRFALRANHTFQKELDWWIDMPIFTGWYDDVSYRQNHTDIYWQYL